LLTFDLIQSHQSRRFCTQFAALSAAFAAALICFGLASATFAAGPSAVPIADSQAREPLLWDDFTLNSNLDGSLWTEQSDLLTALASASSSPASRLLAPTLNFSSKGMEMSGVDGDLEFTGVQSLKSFSPPFILSTTVDGILADADPFEVYLISSDLNQGIDVAGNLNPNNGLFYGIWVNWSSSGLPLNTLGESIYSNPLVNQNYDIAISVDSGGSATVVFALNGYAYASESGLQVGHGPFYLVLAQREGLPYTVGPNKAIWQSVVLQRPVTPTGGLRNVVTFKAIEANPSAFSIQQNFFVSGPGDPACGGYPVKATSENGALWVQNVLLVRQSGNEWEAQQEYNVWGTSGGTVNFNDLVAHGKGPSHTLSGAPLKVISKIKSDKIILSARDGSEGFVSPPFSYPVGTGSCIVSAFSQQQLHGSEAQQPELMIVGNSEGAGVDLSRSAGRGKSRIRPEKGFWQAPSTQVLDVGSPCSFTHETSTGLFWTEHRRAAVFAPEGKASLGQQAEGVLFVPGFGLSSALLGCEPNS
jgi:hypothetical protein